MNLMNGKEIWCRPAPTRTWKLRNVEPVESSRELLAEMPVLIEAAIKRGLATRPSEEPLSNIGPLSVILTCQKCFQRFAQSRTSKYKVCHICRIDQTECKACRKTFQPKQKKQTTCSMACQHELARRAVVRRSEEITSKRPMIQCPICATPFRARWSGGRLSKTCSQPCAIALMASKMKQIRKGE